MSRRATKEHRAMRFGELLNWCNEWGSDQEGLIDLLTDAMHWCDASGEDFFIAFTQACRYHLDELNDSQQHERRP